MSRCACVVFSRRICNGSIKSLLPILHYVFLSFSREFAEFVSDKGYALAGKNDLRFVEGTHVDFWCIKRFIEYSVLAFRIYGSQYVCRCHCCSGETCRATAMLRALFVSSCPMDLLMIALFSSIWTAQSRRLLVSAILFFQNHENDFISMPIKTGHPPSLYLEITRSVYHVCELL